MAKHKHHEEPEPTEAESPVVATEIQAPPAEAHDPAPPIAPAPAPDPEPERKGVDLLKFLYADKKTNEPTPLNWQPRVIGDQCGIVSKFGTLLLPDQSVAKFTHAEAVEVRRYLVALRPNDEIQITNLS